MRSRLRPGFKEIHGKVGQCGLALSGARVQGDCLPMKDGVLECSMQLCTGCRLAVRGALSNGSLDAFSSDHVKLRGPKFVWNRLPTILVGTTTDAWTRHLYIASSQYRWKTSPGLISPQTLEYDTSKPSQYTLEQVEAGEAKAKSSTGEICGI